MATPSLNLTRDQLAEFLKDHDQIKQFEQLFSVVRTLAPILNIDFETGGDTAGASANDALAQAAITETALQPLQTAPLPQQSNSISADYIDFNPAPPHVEKIRRLSWSETNETSDLGMGNGIVHQIGQQYFARVETAGVSNIAKGQVCYYQGVSALGNFLVAEFDAVGLIDPKLVLGLAAAEIVTGGAPSSVICWGRLDGIDTTGTAVGQTWYNGLQLYASETVSGGLTDTPPSAPNDVLPMAVVLVTDSTNGALFVRPQPRDLFNFGIFRKTADQIAVLANTVYAMTWTTRQTGRYWAIGAPTSQLVPEFAGFYEVTATISVTSTTAAAKDAWVWLRIAGADVANSARKVTLTLANETTVVTLNSFITIGAFDALEVMFAANAVGITIDNTAATAFAPQAPAAMIAITQVTI